MDAIARRNLLLAGALAAPAVSAVIDSAFADQAFSSYAYAVGVSTALRTTSSRFSDILNVKDFGAMGDGFTDDTAALNAAVWAAWGSSNSPHGGDQGQGSSLYNNKAVFIPNGHYITSDSIRPQYVTGGLLMGESVGGVNIENTSTTGTAVIQTNGWQYGAMQNLTLTLTNSTGICLDLDLIVSLSSLQGNVQSDAFRNMKFSGGSYGCYVTKSVLAQGSETTWINTSFNNHSIAGFRPAHQNAIMHWFFGGTVDGCRRGFFAPGGGGDVPIINGFKFTNTVSTGDAFDIDISVSSPDTYFITNCNTTSPNFMQFSNNGAVIAGCVQNSTTGIFVYAQGGTAQVPGGSPTPGSVCIYNNVVGGIIQGNGGFYLNGNRTISGFKFTLGFAINGYLGTFVSTSTLNIASLPGPQFFPGTRLMINDSSVSAANSSNYGVALAGGGGSIMCPVWSDGATWRVG